MKKIILTILCAILCMSSICAQNKQEKLEYAFKALATNPTDSYNIFKEVYSSSNRLTKKNREYRAFAEYGLALCQFKGLGCEKNYGEAFMHFQILVVTPGFANSIPDVEYFYGECLYNGYATRKDTEKGLKSFLYAANYGSSLARIKLGKLMLNGEVNPSVQYFEWVKTEAEKDNKQALHVLGNLYLKGIGCDKNIELGNEYLERSHRQ